MKKSINARVNDAEAHFEEEMLGNGWAVSKRGWPDFICYRGDEVIFVEVKHRENCSLSKPQRTVMEILRKHGLKCFRWDTRLGFTTLEGEPIQDIGFKHTIPLEKETLSDFMLRMRREKDGEFCKR